MDGNLLYHQARLGSGGPRDVQGLTVPFPSQRRDSYRRNLAALYMARVHNLKIKMKKFRATTNSKH